MNKGYIFDLDGTLLDSLDAWKDVGNTYLKSIGINGDPNLDSMMENMSLKEGAMYIKEHFSLSQSIEKIIQGVCQIVEERYARDIVLNDGVKNFLEKCYQQGHQMCVLTASSSRLAKQALQRLEVLHYFQDVYSCQTIGLSKQDPQCYLETMKHFQIQVEQSGVVEDALYAIQTAKAAGLCVKAIQNKENQKDWQQICQLSDEAYVSFKEMKP